MAVTSEEVCVPDIGDFHDVEVIEVLVRPGDVVEPETPLITLESDKATMEVPSPRGGRVKALRVKVGDKVSQGSPILVLESASEAAPAGSARSVGEERKAESSPAVSAAGGGAVEAEVLVLGAGPGGYTAAFRAADLGKRVVLVERYPRLGGVCLNVGCIPSKALLHVAQVIEEAHAMRDRGVDFGGPPKIDRDRLVSWKDSVVERLTGGLATMARQRGVRVVHGNARFVSDRRLEVDTTEGKAAVVFESAIIAAGSRAVKPAQFPYDDPRILDSTSALNLPLSQGRLLVVGGGIVALEMAAVYHALGNEVTVAVRSGQLLSGLDSELVAPLRKRIAQRYHKLLFHTEVKAVEAGNRHLMVQFSGQGAPAAPMPFDYILVATGRRPNSDRIACDRAGVAVDGRGFIRVDQQLRTSRRHIFAIGDIAGDPQLAHKASHQGKVAAEVAAGQQAAFDVRAIPSVAYTDPEVAWVGITEPQAKKQQIRYGTGTFPWYANGRALSLGRDEGLTKIVFEQGSQRVIGVGVTGANAGELIAEGTLAIEMGADARDMSLTIHPHPTLSETLMMAAEVFEGTVTDLYLPR